MLSIYKKLLDLLTPPEQRRFYLLLALIIVMGLVDMIGVAVIMPFLSVVSTPEVIRTNSVLAWIYEWAGFETEHNFIVFLGALVFAALIFTLSIRALTLYAIARFVHHRNYSLSSRLFEAYLRQPYDWFLNRHSADMGKSLLWEIDKVVGEVLVPAIRILAYAVSVFFIFLFLMFVAPWIALISVAVLGAAYALIFSLVRRLLTRVGTRRAEANAMRYHISQEALGGIKDVKLLGLEDSFVSQFKAPARKLADSNIKGQVVSEMPRHLMEAVAFGGMISVILGLLFLGSGEIEEIVPIIGVFALAGFRLFPAVQEIYRALTVIRFARPLLDSIHHDVVETRRGNVTRRKSNAVAMPLQRRLELVDLHYNYPKAERVALAGVNLSIDAHQTVGVVGGTGAGKTTLVDIILGLLVPAQGQMIIDGEVLTAENIPDWQANIGYVPQQIFLIDDSVAANIAFGVPAEQRDQAAIERAARLAELDAFVREQLPDGYQTKVGERGVRLSGGQRQRIGIARALYHDPDVLILDEATSALDNVTERAVMDAVRNLGHAKTIIMIAHRLTTIRGCDRILLLDGGRLAAEGTYDQLLEHSETFRRLATVDRVPAAG